MNHRDEKDLFKPMDEQTFDIVKEEMRNWRSWGSWFSWGSPVGLGLFFVLLSFSLLILHWAGWLWAN